MEYPPRNPVPRVGGVCTHRRCLDRAHPEGCRAFAPEVFKDILPEDRELVTLLRTEGWSAGQRRYLEAYRFVDGRIECRELSPAQWLLLKEAQNIPDSSELNE